MNLTVNDTDDRSNLNVTRTAGAKAAPEPFFLFLFFSLSFSHTLVVVVVYTSQSHSFLIDLTHLSISLVYRSRWFIVYRSRWFIVYRSRWFIDLAVRSLSVNLFFVSFNNIQWRQKVSFPLLSLVLIIVCQSRRIGKKPLRTIFPGTTTSTTTPYTAKQ